YTISKKRNSSKINPSIYLRANLSMFLILMNAIYYAAFPIDDFLMARTQLNTDFVVYALYLSVFVLSALLWWNNHNWRQVEH
ncbi:hypothetical protein QP173_05890, partial [Aerococcus urinae]|uniref:hypothetical protein n=2 Tax=Aerococcus TaxID=1375 RepID=UPI00254ECA9D